MAIDNFLYLLGQPAVIVVVAATAVACAAYLVFSALIRVYDAQRAAGAGEQVLTGTQSGLLRSFLPLARVLGLTLHNLCGRGKSSIFSTLVWRVDRALAGAGRPEGLSAHEYIGFGVLDGLLWAMIVMSFVFMLRADQLFSATTVGYFLIGFAFGVLVWRSWLTEKRAKRQIAIQRQLPFALDLLTLAMEAGMDFTSALARIVQKTGVTPLGQELSLMLHEIQLGKTRSDALRDLASRCDVQDLRTVVASLVQAEELGSSLGGVLRIQAAQQRERRSMAAEEKAMKAPIKMMFPMIFILGALFTVLVAPIVLQYLDTF
jgi:tight adherence protein C